MSIIGTNLIFVCAATESSRSIGKGFVLLNTNDAMPAPGLQLKSPQTLSTSNVTGAAYMSAITINVFLFNLSRIGKPLAPLH